MNVTKVTPIFFVDAIEPALPYWCEALGFARVAEVPHEGHLGFVLLAAGASAFMLQTHASLAADLPAIAALGVGHALYLDVDVLDEVVIQSQGADVLVPRRKTFYGADEIWVRAPGGAVVGYAHHA